jgi:hypothetical protein
MTGWKKALMATWDVVGVSLSSFFGVSRGGGARVIGWICTFFGSMKQARGT